MPHTQLKTAVIDRLRSLPPSALKLSGPLDTAIHASVAHHLKKLDYSKLVDFFRQRTNPFAVGEFWGKTMRAACPLLRYTADPELHALVARSVADLLSTQDPDGCISTRTVTEQPKVSDLWDRKYVLLGLISWYELERDPAVLAALERTADHILSQVGPAPKTRIVDTGWAFEGIESSSILDPMLRLYRLTGHQRYLDFATYIVETEGACKRGSIFEAALAGIAPKDINSNGNPKQSIVKAYETMSCFEGLIDYHRITGVAKWRDAAVAYYRALCEREITVLGSGGGEGPFNCGPGTGEQWNDLAFNQHVPGKRLLMETCVTVTWMKFCQSILRLIGDPTVADQLEISLYNALLGALRPSGDFWDYFQNLNGTRNTKVNFGSIINGFPLSCCTANGPSGFVAALESAVMNGAAGPVINLYLPGQSEITLPDGESVRVAIATRYPYHPTVEITIDPPRRRRFTVALRIPAWSTATSLQVNGEILTAKPGTYATIEREWSPGDHIVLALDLRCRVQLATAPDSIAVLRGPLALSRDRRLPGDIAEAVAFAVDDAGHITATSIEPTIGSQLEMTIPTLGDGTIRMIDYASAGSTWDECSEFRTWLPRITATAAG